MSFVRVALPFSRPGFCSQTQGPSTICTLCTLKPLFGAPGGQFCWCVSAIWSCACHRYVQLYLAACVRHSCNQIEVSSFFLVVLMWHYSSGGWAGCQLWGTSGVGCVPQQPLQHSIIHQVMQCICVKPLLLQLLLCPQLGKPQSGTMCGVRLFPRHVAAQRWRQVVLLAPQQACSVRRMQVALLWLVAMCISWSQCTCCCLL